MSEDEFSKLFKHMEKRFADMEKRFDKVDQRFDQLQSSVDAYAKQVLDLTQEHLMLARKVDRMEDWIQKIAQKTGVKLDY
jgi:septal ring factor EnvC (AmiA/AmiB activator)